MKWEMVRLGDIFEVARGGSPRPIDEYWTDSIDGVNWIMISDAKENSKYIEKTNKKIKQKGQIKSRYVNSGDLLLTNSMSFGKPYILKTSGCIHDGWLVLSPKYHKISTEFMFYTLSSTAVKIQMLKNANGAVVKNLNKDIVAKLLIPLPPLDEQKRIADILDKADTIVQKRKESLTLADEYIKSAFIDMFGDPVTNPMGWEVKKLQNLSSLITKGASPNWQGFDYTTDSSQTLFITSENVREKYLSLEKMKFLPNTFNLKQPRSVLKKGDFLINIVGASIGRAAMFSLDVKANINQAVALVRLQENKISEHYLLHYLNSDKALKMYSDMQVSVARANLSLQNISDLEIICPLLPLQEKFAQIVEKTEKTKEKMQKQLDEAENLFKALQQEFFG